MKRWKNRRDWPGKSVMMLGILMMTLGACGSVNSERYFETEIQTSQCMDEKAEIQWDGLHTYAEPAMEQTRICVQTIQGENLLILPSAMSPSAVTFWLEDAASAKLW
ncbi:MAG: hypothetical protein J6I64_04690, partial [Lachnospiraceae bacterium]|nr:hypothetical protein [Lachnospiraceae bacterium]